MTTALTAPARGVGQTAMFVAAVRHLEARRASPLFVDPLAAAMVEELQGDPELEHVLGVVEKTDESSPGFAEYFSVRTRYFDDALRAAADDGVTQFVTLAAGLDARPLRLPMGAGIDWFELDMPEVVDFKNALIDRAGLSGTCRRHGVPIDLTENWAPSLRAAGFDPRRPTAWLLEGLLMYLPPEAADALLATLGRSSAEGSRLLVEQLQASMLEEYGRPVRERVESQGTTWRSARDDVSSWLADHGWRAAVHASTDPAIAHGRTVAPLPACWLASARRITRS